MRVKADISAGGLDGFVDPSTYRFIGPAEFEELVKAKERDEVVIAPVRSDVVDESTLKIEWIYVHSAASNTAASKTASLGFYGT